VPDTAEFHLPGFWRAGALAQLGFLDAIHSSGMNISLILSCQPMAYHAVSRRWICPGTKIKLYENVHITLVPAINLFAIREIMRWFFSYAYLAVWSLRNIRHRRVVVTYNISYPPILPLRLITWLFRGKLCSILYDVVPPDNFDAGWLRNIIIHGLIKNAGLKCIPWLDGRIVITDELAQAFAPSKPFLRVDGGVTDLVTNRLFELKPSSKDDLVMMFAGSLYDINHIQLILEMFAQHPDAKMKLWVAGDGVLRDTVIEASRIDTRVTYYGALNHDKLFELYQKTDIILCLRDTSDSTMKYHFPSKVLETLLVGKMVMTTPTTHLKKDYGHLCYVLEDETPEGCWAMVQQIWVLTPDERCEKGKKSRDFMLKNRTWKALGPSIKSYLESL